VGAGAETAGDLLADIELDVRVGHQQRLGVRVDRDELDALETGLDHAVDGVDTSAADADDLDDCGGDRRSGDVWVLALVVPPPRGACVAPGRGLPKPSTSS